MILFKSWECTPEGQSKVAKYYKEYKIVDFFLYFQLAIEKVLKNYQKQEKYLKNVNFWVAFFISFNFDLEVEQNKTKPSFLQFFPSFDTLYTKRGFLLEEIWYVYP